jgi:hypothetical protein
MKINDNNYFKYYENCKINNLIMDGYFQFDKIYLENKKEIIYFIENNKNNHRIKTDRNEVFLIKDLIDNIELDPLKIYDIVIHLRLDDFIELDDFIDYRSIIRLLKEIGSKNGLKNNKIAIVIQKIYSKEDNEYLNNLLNWFKQNNIEVNVESNDLITDFNIMKQCKTLICSNSTLSWSAAYLSKNIELCYMPTSISNEERFKKPIENTLFYNTIIENNCYICGCILNGEDYLKNVFHNIKKIGEIFDHYKIIIAYDESTDKTLDILYELKDELKCEFEIIINNNAISECNTLNISNARNSILEYIRNDNNDSYQYFIMMDLDDVCEKEINVNILKKYLKYNNWDSLSFNKKDYYDIWALSIRPFVTSCWHWNKTQMGSSYIEDIIKNYIIKQLNNLDKNDLLECYSAFNGFAIYRKDKFINCNYDNNIFKSHALLDNKYIIENKNELNKLTKKDNILYMNLLEDCEHRYFHLSAMQKNNAKNMISPLYLFNDGHKEDKCYYVSSRGILKSCDNKSLKPISSINDLRNYNFNKLYDGCTIYVCNYAIPFFIERALPLIQNKFILVSGDSDCTVPDELFNNNDFHAFINNEKLIHWYAQNCILNHPKLSRIPIGLDYHTMSEKNSEWGDKIDCNLQEDMLNNIKNESKPFWEREIKCYANFHFTINTKYGNDRIDAMKYINKELVFYENKKVNRKETWENQSKYAFVISPHGNGLDCHRTWEALCLGSIPIVKNSGISEDLFYKLPVLIVDNWKDVTIELLKRTINKFRNTTFNYEKLTLKYWMDNIKFKINNHNIPKIIYQTWKTKELPNEIINIQNEILRINPGYKIELYDDNDIDNFIKNNFDNTIYNAFNKLNVGAAKADFWRYLILYKNGGIYLDIDSNILKPIDEIIEKNDLAVISREGCHPYFLQWLLIFTKNHLILKNVIDYCVYNIMNETTSDIINLTGPGVFTKAINNTMLDYYDKKKINLYYEKDEDLNKYIIKCKFYGIDYNHYAEYSHKYKDLLYINNIYWKNEKNIFKKNNYT